MPKLKDAADLKKTHFYGYHVATDDMWNVKQAVHPILMQGTSPTLFSLLVRKLALLSFSLRVSAAARG
jgi:hypothetical protein